MRLPFPIRTTQDEKYEQGSPSSVKTYHPLPERTVWGPALPSHLFRTPGLLHWLSFSLICLCLPPVQNQGSASGTGLFLWACPVPTVDLPRLVFFWFVWRRKMFQAFETKIKIKQTKTKQEGHMLVKDMQFPLLHPWGIRIGTPPRRAVRKTGSQDPG